MLDEIAELASGGGENAQGLADATIRRLGNKSPIVKQKVLFTKGTTIFPHPPVEVWHGLQALRLIKHVTNKGASEYRRAICKQAKEVRCGLTSQMPIFSMPACNPGLAPMHPWVTVCILG